MNTKSNNVRSELIFNPRGSKNFGIKLSNRELEPAHIITKPTIEQILIK